VLVRDEEANADSVSTGHTWDGVLSDTRAAGVIAVSWWRRIKISAFFHASSRRGQPQACCCAAVLSV